MPRMTIQFPKQVDDALKALAAKDGTTKAEVIRRALSLYDYVQKETDGDKRQLSITEGERIVGDIILPR